MIYIGRLVKTVILLLMCFVGYSAIINAQEEDEYETVFKLPVAKDMTVLSSNARKKNLPILLMYSAEYCEWCERLEQEVLGPMDFSGEYTDRVIIRKIMVDSAGNIIDFDGKAVEADNFRFRRGIQVTPTLQFVGADGEELAPQIIGFKTPEFFAAYLENALRASEQKLNAATSQQ